MSEAALEKVQLERDGLAKELQLVQSAIPKDKSVSAPPPAAATSLDEHSSISLVVTSHAADLRSVLLFSPLVCRAAEALIAFMAEKTDPFNTQDNEWASASGDGNGCCTIA
jgi:hypothetical protein